MAESAAPKVPRDGSLVIQDGTTPTANTYTVQYSGDVSFGEKITEAIHVFNRGTRTYTRKGNEGIPTLSFRCDFCSWTDATDGTAWDALEGKGGFSSWAKELSTVEHYNVGLVFTVEGTDHGDDADHTATITGFRPTDIQFAEGDPYQITVTGEILGTITYVGGA